ncbi:phosphoglycerate kinase [Candidatus Shapirobacteria bacterium]|nr:phosphoglycerate kinase [Candidatus Shapirobacteria bacterium]
MKLRSVEEILPETKVILKLDLDVPMNDGDISDNYRLVKSIPTIKLLLAKKCQVSIVGKLGRPEGHDPKYSMRPVYVELMSLLEPNGENLIESIFVEDVGNFEKLDMAMATNQIVFLENLRFWKGEEANDSDFLKNLVEICQFFVNDALAVSHRKERSNMLYKSLPGFYGLAFISEVEKILKVVDDPSHPLTIVLGGAKADKLSHLPELLKIADHVLIGGKLPLLINNSEELIVKSEKIKVAKLREDGFDLSKEDIAQFKEIIGQSKMVVWAGAMGWFEKDDCKEGTKEIAMAVASSPGYKVLAGGDTTASVESLGMKEQIDLIASGGGMMLELLTKGSLPAWE